ncbi:hypothetical protein [Salininema proteolyticum]|uniref:Minor tail protein n=1 Tax=Salininema proteolyticum TaxID=1607685 RepID=A0ABV8TTM0_9ACTN
MAWESWPFDGQETTEDQYRMLFREFMNTGVLGTWGDNELRVIAEGDRMGVTLLPGAIYIQGHYGRLTGRQQIDIAPAGVTERRDRIVARLDPARNSIEAVVLQGDASGEYPPLTETETGIFETGLAGVVVRPGATAITSEDIAIHRALTHTRVGLWADSGRPNRPKRSQLGWNETRDRWEYWHDQQWKLLAPDIQTGTERLSFSGVSYYKQRVEFPEPFSGTPTVTTNINTGAGYAARWISRAINIGRSAFNLFVFAADGRNDATWDGGPVMWQAIYRP